MVGYVISLQVCLLLSDSSGNLFHVDNVLVGVGIECGMDNMKCFWEIFVSPTRFK